MTRNAGFAFFSSISPPAPERYVSSGHPFVDWYHMIRKGDNVIVISGANRGKTGKVSRVFPREKLVVVESVNLRKRHQKARRANQKGQILEKAMPIHLSNVALLEGGKPVRVGRKLIGERWVRVSRRSGKEI